MSGMLFDRLFFIMCLHPVSCGDHTQLESVRAEGSVESIWFHAFRGPEKRVTETDLKLVVFGSLPSTVAYLPPAFTITFPKLNNCSYYMSFKIQLLCPFPGRSSHALPVCVRAPALSCHRALHHSITHCTVITDLPLFFPNKF